MKQTKLIINKVLDSLYDNYDMFQTFWDALSLEQQAQIETKIDQIIETVEGNK